MAEEPSGATWLGSSRRDSSSVPVADEYEVVVDKSNSLPLGLWVSTGEGEVDRLRVDCVCEGVAEQWNIAHPDCQIREGDYIVEVNGTRGDAVLMEQKCQRSRVVRMRLMREASWTQRTRDTLQDAATSGLNSARALSEDVAVLGLGSAMLIADGLLSFSSAASCVVKGGLADVVSSVFSQQGQADAPKGLQDMGGRAMSSSFFAHGGSGVAQPQRRSREHGYLPQFYLVER